ncbi:hypothetical protein GCM10007907_18210 [Chitinimonas prasina]|uniref:Uncharacterized protein n=1 Tax=Chitinimonas prasina TaxID=1434937 RepID=A0ABQ5YER1_9NEIS|nr:hypothetical protein [Chitinimonas prasina]GLR13031.1 hypothetical protein GCM10007907_18210 [Chitinimonas prasina]
MTALPVVGKMINDLTDGPSTTIAGVDKYPGPGYYMKVVDGKQQWIRYDGGRLLGESVVGQKALSQQSQALQKTTHAELRKLEGRNVGKVINDIQTARPSDVFVPVKDGAYMVRGPNGREYYISADG